VDAAAGVDGSDVDSLGEDGDATSGDDSDSVGAAGGDDGTVEGVLGESSGKLSGDEEAALEDDGANVGKDCGVDGSADLVGSSSEDECLTGVVGVIGVAGLVGVAGSLGVIGSTGIVGLTGNRGSADNEDLTGANGPDNGEDLTGVEGFIGLEGFIGVEDLTSEEGGRTDSTGISRFEESGDSTGNRCSTEGEGRDKEAPGVGCGFSTGVMLPAIALVSKSLMDSPIMILDPVPLESLVTRWT